MALGDYSAHEVSSRARKTIQMLGMHVRLQLEMGRAKAYEKTTSQQSKRQNSRNTRSDIVSRFEGF
jgi:hypothetical protein